MDKELTQKNMDAISLIVNERQRQAPKHWPWDLNSWKPSPDNRIKELVKAGALVVAEIERLQRLEKSENIIVDSMKHHGLIDETKLPDSLKNPDFLFSERY
jgi:hypothetical protein